MTAALPAHLTEAEVAAYRERGIVVPGWRLPAERLARLRAALERVIAANPGLRPETLISAHIAEGGREGVRGDSEFLRLACDPDILGMVAQLIGPDLVLWGCQIFCKPGGDGREVPWHQDGHYWPIRPLATCTAWVAIDDSRVENGCLRVIPGSHRAGLHEHLQDDRPLLALDRTIVPQAMAGSPPFDVELPAGALSLHDVHLIHGSAPNRSPRRRAGVALRYMPAAARFDRTLFQPRTTAGGLAVDFATRPLWLVAGRDVAGNGPFAPLPAG
jgi:ectoine hydroxylase-related dioxygenase (phytanoyl-CoA dioxygenase family)